MSLIDAIKKIDAETALDVVVRGLDAIGSLAGSANSHNAADIVMAIKHIYRVITDAVEERIAPEEARAELAKFVDGISSNDAVADKAAADKE